MSEHVYALAKQHHSVRKFKSKAIDREVIRKLIEAGQMASTSSFLQTTSVIGVESLDKKEALKEVSGQPYVVENGYLLVFVLDYHRHHLISEKRDAQLEGSFESAEGLLVGTVDAALMAQNIALTAEDMGYGIVYLGSLRNDVPRVREILGLPEFTFPLFGMAIGEPADDENGTPKPRLPFEHVFHVDGYNTDDTQLEAQLEDYDETVSNYYNARTHGERTETWSEQITQFMSSKQRLEMLNWLQMSGFNKK
ncbi:NADPH-dependent oxidoreductase [Staphylococcus agnetis]|uniref:oxygen-insensitive NADPH nitroreductase n=1 Tax=Staphylococcus agnetis TaxID=985762 RepID=UPI000D03BB26|nr:oxygen-insensitive NADPH nitroreductase [Staphylococcus agnetis]MCO4327739.1 oxygen-insensitive NADPH nitroreductase [Staphylococcus agnetis]MCO4342072.1 oxygen-insensitive NADPH nitroreductase [Staphylococcus agnetis]MCO4342436.1 oxygen-insensitive NADPH nitroreductase [Staphylococcus agnetis]MCO4344439.1 oxygen-insensitive NADPH nitroreductase [Staphylococcus agnetis]MCO4349134.1 oxygen-insensitive NADPH nitroreductase [Staphylococcus agnetis]